MAEQQPRGSAAAEVSGRLRALDEAVRTAAPHPRLAAWASTRLGLSGDRLDAWARRAGWGIAAGELALHWLSMPDTRAAYLSLVDAPDWSEVDRARTGGGVILATAHLGPRKTAMHLCLERRWPLMVWTNLGPGDETRLRGVAPDADFANPLDPATAPFLLAQTAAHLRVGGILFAAPDVDSGARTFTLDRLGCTWTFSLGIPALARRLQIPVFLVLALWRGGRIRVEIQPLPSPAATLTEDAWYEAWITNFWNRLEELVTTTPENVRTLRWILDDDEIAGLLTPSQAAAGHDGAPRE